MASCGSLSKFLSVPHAHSAYRLKPRQSVVDIPDQESQNLVMGSTSSWGGRENLATSLQ